MELIDFKNLKPEELNSYFVSLGENKFRSQQLIEWMFKKRVSSFDDMSNFSKTLREQLKKDGYLSGLKLVTTQSSQDETRKFLFELEDCETVETVLMPHRSSEGGGRMTLCVSTQVGCRMGCKFCLTASQGLVRHLKCSEILNQISEVQELLESGILKETPFEDLEKITNIVMMGMGEPLDNFDNVLRALGYITGDRAFEIPAKRVTVSTSGLVTKIEELGQKSNVNLAISLNASTNPTRSEIMPINKPYPIEKLMDVTKKFYTENKRRKIMFEYVLLKDVNDSEQDAHQLAKHLRGTAFKVNLIPFNEHPKLPYKQPSQERIEKFQDILKKNKIFSFIRWSKGRDISAACGQLRSP
ncbi:MAG TPA: 23S rRNA (adenine(2503)-C(2))-methyltransferase RlmN [Bdellovibrionota bacterium]|nr:23S rRNA (adenine(2503)-C(2))-methyltransferase RlmN [Bdellovibrionota bacterium]